MNAYKISTEVLHSIAILYLFWNILRHKSFEGISYKAHLLYIVAFNARYLDMYLAVISNYTTIKKIVFICLSAGTILLSYGLEQSYGILWTLSEYLELAIIPQMYMIWKSGKITQQVLYYLLFLPLYKIMYLYNVIYKYQVYGYCNVLSQLAGLVDITICFLTLLILSCKKVVTPE